MKPTHSFATVICVLTIHWSAMDSRIVCILGMKTTAKVTCTTENVKSFRLHVIQNIICSLFLNMCQMGQSLEKVIHGEHTSSNRKSEET